MNSFVNRTKEIDFLKPSNLSHDLWGVFPNLERKGNELILIDNEYESVSIQYDDETFSFNLWAIRKTDGSVNCVSHDSWWEMNDTLRKIVSKIPLEQLQGTALEP